MPLSGNSHPRAGDRELVTAFQRGDEGAYEEIYRRHIDRVRRSCSRVLPDPRDVEEAAQETFLKAYQALGHFNGRYLLGAWLSRIAVNVSIDHVRSRSRQHLVGLSSETSLEWPDEGPEEVVAGGSPRVTETLKDIQPLHAAALQLRAVHGLSHREMARRLRMSPDQVKALLHRARRSFKRAWEKAEGWALAPVFAVRSMFEHRSQASHAGVAGGQGFVGITQSLTAMERAVTGAVIAAVALTGLPSEPSRPSTPSPSRAPVAGPQAPGGRGDAHTLPPSRSTAVSVGDEADALDQVLELAAKAREAAEPNEGGSEPPSGGEDGDGGDDPPLGGPAQQKKKAVDTGRKVVERVDQTLADR